MSESLLEVCNSRGTRMAVDRQAGVIRGVKVLGFESRNGRTYLPKALVNAAALYEGVKVNVNHPRGGPHDTRDYRDRIGQIRNVKLREREGLFGDLYFNPKHPLAEQLAWDAENAPENVGLSHNVDARVARHGNQSVVEKIVRVQSVDLVADPATTRGLFEAQMPAATEPIASEPADSEDTETPPTTDCELLKSITLEQLMACRPDLVAAIRDADSEEINRLGRELDTMKASAAVEARSRTIDRLLAEFRLPSPHAGDQTARDIVSASFVESLMAAPDEGTMRTMVEQLSRVVKAAQANAAYGWNTRGRPESREQLLADVLPGDKIDGLRFAQAILRR